MVLMCLENCLRQLQTAENFSFSLRLAEKQNALSFKDPVCFMNWEESGPKDPGFCSIAVSVLVIYFQMCVCMCILSI